MKFKGYLLINGMKKEEVDGFWIKITCSGYYLERMELEFRMMVIDWQRKWPYESDF